MNKEAFLYTLRQELNGLPEEDLEERLGFYDEMIEDLVDEGLSEEEAVAKMGNAEAIAQQIMKDRPSMSVDTDTIKEKAKTIFNNILSSVKLTDDNADFVTNAYTFEEPFENIDINVEDAKISIEPTEESFVKVVCEEPEECAHEVKVEDNTLIIRYKEEHSIIRFNIAHRPSITIYLPKKVYGDIKIESDCGPIALSKGLTFTNLNANCDAASFNCSADVIDNMEVECDCGTMRLSDLTCGCMNLENDAGKIELKNVNCERDIHIEDDCGSIVLSKVNCESLYCENDAGKIDLSNVIAQRHINLSDDCGAISIKDCDCADARIKNEIGSIKGHFLSDKKFIAESEVGSINVPEGKEGGLCKVTTEIGSIYFD